MILEKEDGDREIEEGRPPTQGGEADDTHNGNAAAEIVRCWDTLLTCLLQNYLYDLVIHLHRDPNG